MFRSVQTNFTGTAHSDSVFNTVYSTKRHTFQPCRASLRKDQELLTALFQSARREALPWLNDLTLPAFGVPDPEFAKLESEAKADDLPVAEPTYVDVAQSEAATD